MVNYRERSIAPRVASLELQVDPSNVINDTLSGDARLQSPRITSHRVKSKYLGFLDLQLFK